MIKRLRTKFVCINMALVTVMLLVIFGLVYHFTATGLEENSIAALKSATEVLQRPGRPGMATQPVFTLEQTPWGELIATGGEYFDLTDAALLQDIYNETRRQPGQTGVLEGYSLRYYRMEGPVGVRYAFADVSSERMALQNLVRSCAVIGAVSFLAFLGISILLSRWAVRPVDRAWKQQRQFVADASHELKTPLTVILTNAELLQSEDYAPEEKEQFSASILAMSRQMRGLVEGLLDLARVDNGQAKADMQPLDFSRLAEEAVLPFEPVYFEQGLTLESSVEPGLTVVGSGRHLRQAVDILLDNGQKYSSPGGTAQLTLMRQGRGKVLLSFTTPGTPLTQQQCGDIFKRFYRVDEARAMSGSYGLGLSIAQRIVEDHKGKIWAQGHEGGNTFSVLLPEA